MEEELKNINLDIELYNNTLYISTDNATAVVYENIRTIDDLTDGIKQYIQNYVKE